MSDKESMRHGHEHEHRDDEVFGGSDPTPDSPMGEPDAMDERVMGGPNSESDEELLGADDDGTGTQVLGADRPQTPPDVFGKER